jgi:cyclopropane-fatty-acyl-phospholipid synthase
MLAGALLKNVVRDGTLTVIDADGKMHSYGNGGLPAVAIRLKDRSLHHRLLYAAPMAFGEGYMDGTLVMEEGRIEDLLALLFKNLESRGSFALLRLDNFLHRVLRPLHQFNPLNRARKNVAHHYDLSGAFYQLFLDPDQQYSCAYFATPTDTLEAAQEQKKRHIAAKLHLSPGQRVLDIGSGWGGLALYLARIANVDVTGITLSSEQLKAANARTLEAGIANRVRFDLRDYRRMSGQFDRIVSVGMFEHVGVDHYQAFFNKIGSLLTDDGAALIHTIGRSDGPGATSPWIRKYIFPGGYTPALSEVLPAIERAGLIVTDVETLRQHYADTLAEWQRRFRAHWHEAMALYDERFCRMWEFYLAGAEMGFRHQGLVVFQIQLTKRIDALPITRDYMLDWERTNAPSIESFARERSTKRTGT